MAKARNYIAIDLGAESGRCVVGTIADGQIVLQEVHRFPTHHIQVGHELVWDVLAIFDDIRFGLSRAVAECGDTFAGIGVDSWAVDYALLDGDGRLLGYPAHYRSPRTDGMMDDVFGIVPADRIYERTGIQFMPINTLYQLRSEQHRATNLLEVADRLMMIPDLIHYLLCGSPAAEFTNASTTQLVDPEARDWAWDLIDALALPRGIFPRIVQPATELGTLHGGLADGAGMAASPPVYAGACHDTAAAVAAVPAAAGSWAYLSSGSWSLMGVELDQPLINARSQATNFTNEGGVGGTTRFLKNIGGLWLLQASRRHWGDNGRSFTYPELEAAAVAAGPAGAWVDPNDGRFLAPGDMPARIIDSIRSHGGAADVEPGWISRCIFESLAFKYREIFGELEAMLGRRIDRLHIVGGGTRNRLLCQMTADALNREVVAGPVEATVVGNIGMQAVAGGDINDHHALREVVAQSFELETYLPGDTRYWDEHYEQFLAVAANV